MCQGKFDDFDEHLDKTLEYSPNDFCLFIEFSDKNQLLFKKDYSKLQPLVQQTKVLPHNHKIRVTYMILEFTDL